MATYPELQPWELKVNQVNEGKRESATMKLLGAVSGVILKLFRKYTHMEQIQYCFAWE
jgi:hypothetical protein